MKPVWLSRKRAASAIEERKLLIQTALELGSRTRRAAHRVRGGEPAADPEAAGGARSTPAYFFGSKAALYHAVLARAGSGSDSRGFVEARLVTPQCRALASSLTCTSLQAGIP